MSVSTRVGPLCEATAVPGQVQVITHRLARTRSRGGAVGFRNGAARLVDARRG